MTSGVGKGEDTMWRRISNEKLVCKYRHLLAELVNLVKGWREKGTSALSSSSAVPTRRHIQIPSCTE